MILQGYSLFEVEFKTPGTDDTASNAATSALQFPANNSNRWTPLPTSVEPLETLQFTLSDGTLVILWHGGEADRARQRFETLSKADREALLAFLKSL